MLYVRRDPNENRNKFYDDMHENILVPMYDHALDKALGISKFGYVVDGLQFMNDPFVDTALSIGLSNLISYGINGPVTGLVYEACAAFGIAAGPAGLIAAGVVGFLSYLGSESIINCLHFLFESSGSSGPFIFISLDEKLGLVPIKKPDDWLDEEFGGPGGIEFNAFMTIKNFSSNENVLSSKSNIFFKTEFKEDVENAFNSICLPEFRGKSIQSYFETIMREVSDGLDITSQLPYISL